MKNNDSNKTQGLLWPECRVSWCVCAKVWRCHGCWETDSIHRHCSQNPRLKNVHLTRSSTASLEVKKKTLGKVETWMGTGTGRDTGRGRNTPAQNKTNIAPQKSAQLRVFNLITSQKKCGRTGGWGVWRQKLKKFDACFEGHRWMMQFINGGSTWSELTAEVER